MKAVLRSVLVVAVVLLVGAGPVWGQATASLSGTISDPTGAVIPGAEVKLTAQGTGVTRTATSGPNGVYVFPSLAPTTYKLEVSAQGFKTHVRPSLAIQVGVASTLNVTLEVGAVTEVVEVTGAAAAPINTTDASIGNALSASEVRNLPQLNLDPAGLLSLQPGVTYVPSRPDTPGGYSGGTDYDIRGGSVNGSRSDQTNVTLDGIDVNDPEKGYAFTSVLRVTQAALQEFRVNTSNANADLGRSSAAQVQLVTKSGSNDFHGSAYYAHRNEAFNANDFFLNRSGLKEPKFRRHIYGAALGGPIKKNRAFVFGNWERMQESLFDSASRDVPSMAFRDGVFVYKCRTASACPGNSVTGFSGATYTAAPGVFAVSPAQGATLDPCSVVACTDPLGRAITPGPSLLASVHNRKFPVPNDPGSFDRLNIVGFRFGGPVDNIFNTYLLRFDFNLDPAGKHVLFWRGILQDDIVESAPQFPGLPPNQTAFTASKGFALAYTAALSPTFTNDFHWGLTRLKNQNAGNQTQSYIDFRFISNLQDYESDSFGRTIPLHQFRDDVTLVRGKHTLRFGGDARFTRNNRYDNGTGFHYFNINPSWLQTGGREVLPGAPDCLAPGCTVLPRPSAGRSFRDGFVVLLTPITFATANYNFDRTGAPKSGFIRRRFGADEYEMYLYDQWRPTPSLAINLGVRYFIASPPWETNGNQVIPTPTLGEWFDLRRHLMKQGLPTSQAGKLVFELGGKANKRPGYYAWDWNNWSPRISVAFSPRSSGGLLGKLFGGGKFVIRGGYSLVYDRIGNALATTFDTSGSFGLTTAVDSFFGLCDTGREQLLRSRGGSPARYFRVPCARFTSLFDTAAAQKQILPPSPCAGTPCNAPEGLLSVAGGLDSTIQTPFAHVIDLSIARELPGGFAVEAAYVGRRGRRLLIIRDNAMHADLCDTGPGRHLCAFQAAQELIHLAELGKVTTGITPLDYWQNLFPSFGPSGVNGGCLQFDVFGVDPNGNCGFSATQVAFDYILGYHGTLAGGTGFGVSTAWQDFDYFGFPGFLSGNIGCPNGTDLDGDGFKDCPFAFFPSQFVNLQAWSSIGRSEYHALQVMVRKRMSRGISFNLNYTMSKSLDHTSTPERADIFVPFSTGATTGTTLNAWDINKEYSFSDFDIRHQLNGYWNYELPFGRGKWLGSNVAGWLDQIMGGWQLSGILRFNTGLPVNVYNGRTWPTNWNLSVAGTCAPVGAHSFGTATGPCPSTQNVKRAKGRGTPNLFADPEEAVKHFRHTLPGDRGGRNNFRADKYESIDLALAKSFKMPWEGHKLQVRWETFNLTNSVYFDAIGILTNTEDAGTFGDYTRALGGPRRMQFSLRYEF